ncbi:MAG TPA: SxtJ family membrane protein [candidate division Zixibacteria bacterium]|nr:SxtJ family membrane protein [candidate division Zixibacteria bacterium]
MSATESGSSQPRLEPTPLHQRDMAMLLALIGVAVGYWNKDLRWVLGAGVVLVLGLIAPILFKPLAAVWLTVTHFVGLVVSRIILSLIYFLIVTPIGLFRRWTGRDTLHVGRFKKEDGSAFNKREKQFGPDDLERPY